MLVPKIWNGKRNLIDISVLYYLLLATAKICVICGECAVFSSVVDTDIFATVFLSLRNTHTQICEVF